MPGKKRIVHVNPTTRKKQLGLFDKPRIELINTKIVGGVTLAENHLPDRLNLYEAFETRSRKTGEVLKQRVLAQASIVPGQFKGIFNLPEVREKIAGLHNTSIREVIFSASEAKVKENQRGQVLNHLIKKFVERTRKAQRIKMIITIAPAPEIKRALEARGFKPIESRKEFYYFLDLR